MKKVSALIVSALMLCGLLLVGCGGGSSSNPPASTPASTPASAPASTPESTPESTPDADDPGEAGDYEPLTIRVAAAASLENAYTQQLIPMFAEQQDWISIEGTYDSSGKLQTQIKEGLGAAVFMSAATKQMNALVDGGFIDPASVVELLENEIVLIAPMDSDTTIDAFERIGEAESIALGDPASVPAGQYAQEALTNLGVYDSIADKVSEGTNVTEVLAAVAEGSADVGIVYATDAASMPDQVKVLATAPEGSLETKVIYPVGIWSEAIGAEREAADLFVAFLQSPEALAVFEAYGFKSNVQAAA